MKGSMLAAIAMATCAGYPVASVRIVAPATGSNGTPRPSVSGTDRPPPGGWRNVQRRPHRHARVR